MQELGKDYTRFLDLLRFALDDRAVTLPEGFSAPTAKEWQLFYGIARIQNMTGLLFRAAEKMPQELKTELQPSVWEHLQADARTISSNHTLHRAIIAAQSKTWAENGIEAQVLKGIETAKFYPSPELRTLGDIDWWIVKPDDWQKAIDVVNSKGCTTNLDSDGDINYMVYGVVVEHHRHGLAVPGTEGELLLLCNHILHHAQFAGLDLRQLYDYAVACRTTHDTIDSISYSNLIEKDNLVRWNSVLDNLSEYLLHDGVRLSKDAETLLRFALFGSNFFTRSSYFLRLTPGKYVSRLLNLCFGRTKRLINR